MPPGRSLRSCVCFSVLSFALGDPEVEVVVWFPEDVLVEVEVVVWFPRLSFGLEVEVEVEVVWFPEDVLVAPLRGHRRRGGGRLSRGQSTCQSV